MRTKDILIDTFDDILILYRYLYSSPEHSVTVSNALCNLTIKMKEDLPFTADNQNFPELPPMNYSEELTLPQLVAIVSQLKVQPPQEFGFPTGFKTHWEEICAIVNTTLGLNKQ